MVIIYLDFDGVLHHYDVYLDQRNRAVLRGMGALFEYASRLESILAPYPNFKIVLSTSWVRVKGFQYAADRLPEGLRSRVIGATWHSKMTEDDELLFWWLNHSTRYQQIIRDVRHRMPEDWLAIDDDAEGWPTEAKRHLITCNPILGLSEPDVRMTLEQRLASITNNR